MCSPVQIRNAITAVCLTATAVGAAPIPAPTPNPESGGDVSFTDVTPATMLSGNTRGAAWGDYDGDGDPDLYITFWAEPNRLFRNDDGVFTDVTTPTLQIIGGNRWSGRAVWGDYDNDGDLDLFVPQSQDSHLLRNDSGTFVDVTGGEPLQLGNRLARSASWGDLDNDGMLDLYVASDLGVGNRSFYLHNELAARQRTGPLFTDVSVAFNVADPGTGRGVALADVDGNGNLDIYVANGASPDGILNPGRLANHLYRNDCVTFTDISEDALFACTHSRGACWGDYDNDGDFDLYVTAIYVTEGACCFGTACVFATEYSCELSGGVFMGKDTSCEDTLCPSTVAPSSPTLLGGQCSVSLPNGRNTLLRNDHATNPWRFTDVTAGDEGYAGSTRGGSFADYDNDGDLDLLLINIGEPNQLLRNDNGTFTNVATGPILGSGGSGTVGAWADYDRDGDLDVFLGALTGADSALLRNDLDNDNNWFQVRLVGTQSNASCIGAEVRVTAGGVTQLRQIESGSGYFEQHEMIAHFGLGGASTIDQLHVRWPSGAETTINGFLPNFRVSLNEPGIGGNDPQCVSLPECPADCTPSGGNGVVNFDDLVSVISAISTQDLSCDVYPVNFDTTIGDGVVNIDDLLAVITFFGPCP